MRVAFALALLGSSCATAPPAPPAVRCYQSSGAGETAACFSPCETAFANLGARSILVAALYDPCTGECSCVCPLHPHEPDRITRLSFPLNERTSHAPQER